MVADAAKQSVWLNTMESAQGLCPVSKPELASHENAWLVTSGICL
jgi:hypothetical protein